MNKATITITYDDGDDPKTLSVRRQTDRRDAAVVALKLTPYQMQTARALLREATKVTGPVI